VGGCYSRFSTGCRGGCVELEPRAGSVGRHVGEEGRRSSLGQERDGVELPQDVVLFVYVVGPTVSLGGVATRASGRHPDRFFEIVLAGREPSTAAGSTSSRATRRCAFRRARPIIPMPPAPRSSTGAPWSRGWQPSLRMTALSRSDVVRRCLGGQRRRPRAVRYTVIGILSTGCTPLGAREGRVPRSAGGESIVSGAAADSRGKALDARRGPWVVCA